MKASEKQITVKGEAINIRRTSGRGLPVIFLHGLLDSNESWDYIALSISRPTVAIDIPGFGGSELREERVLRDYSKTIFSVIDRLGIDKFYLAGHSLGGAIASDMADLRPARIKKMFLIAPAGFGKIPLAELANKRLVRLALVRTTPTVFKSHKLLDLFYMNFISFHKPIERELASRVGLNSKRMIQGTIRAVKILNDLSVNPFFSSKYKGEVFALWGDRDALISKNHTSQFKQVFPQAKVSVIRDIGHHPQFEYQNNFLNIFVREVSCKKTSFKGVSEKSLYRSRSGLKLRGFSLPASAKTLPGMIFSLT